LCCNQTLPKSADDHRATQLHHVPGHDPPLAENVPISVFEAAIEETEKRLGLSVLIATEN
jgi:hypothetical protein